MLIVHNQEPKPLWITVVIPPKSSNHPIEAFVELADAMEKLKKLPEGTRYASMRVQGDVLSAIMRSGWKGA